MPNVVNANRFVVSPARGTRSIRRVRRVLLWVCTLGLALPAIAAMPPGEQVARGSNCFSCHAVGHKVVGPAFAAIARRFAHQPGAKAVLVHAVKFGHVGTWGDIPMPPHPNLTEQQLDQVVSWVLSIRSGAKPAVAAIAKTYHYTVNGKAFTLDFPVFRSGTKKVTATVFRGYELFNSYCFRCHGEDATGSEYAPDLRQSVLNGMTEAQMTQICHGGPQGQGHAGLGGVFLPA
ncbi:MAG: c-type cytochrome [Steroidobacteraceae bacterium]